MGSPTGFFRRVISLSILGSKSEKGKVFLEYKSPISGNGSKSQIQILKGSENGLINRLGYVNMKIVLLHYI